MTMGSLRFRWLGVAGVELACAGQVLLIDPFLTRFSLRSLLRPLRSDGALLARHLPRADVILLSHPHWDHLFDVPALIAQTGSHAYGSHNSDLLLQAAGVPSEQSHRIAVGDRLALGPFRVTVLPAEHVTLLGRTPLRGELQAPISPPCRPWHYKMDEDFSFLIEAGGWRCLYWSGVATGPAPSADLLFVQPFGDPERFAPLLRAVEPRWVVPVHWDDFLQPLTAPPRPSFEPPRRGWPPLRRVDLSRFTARLARLAPEAEVFVPRRLVPYAFAALSRSRSTDEVSVSPVPAR
jgi:L-ascorbate metabolism protein UlaG (beta-lactamase superfamily)